MLNSIDTVHDSATHHSGESTPLGIECERYSSITKLLRVTALALRFIKRLRDSKCKKGPLTRSEIDGAKKKNR